MTDLNTRATEYLAKADAATPGPWRLCASDEYPWRCDELAESQDTFTVVNSDGFGVLSFPEEHCPAQADKALIAASHDAAQLIRDYQQREAELVAECERLRKELEIAAILIENAP